ncbi:MAG: hypothetical protein OXB95_14260 [Rhodobacteraceae bacterium]|nr:hypothetical protein [Paracoccaceae bacterium]
MAKRSALKRITDVLKPQPAVLAPISPVELLDVTKLAKDLELEEEGRARGERNMPATDSTVPDDIEMKISSHIKNAVIKVQQEAQDQLHTYDQRQDSISLEEQFSKIDQARYEAITEFRQEVQEKLNDLHLPRRRLLEVEYERWYFRNRNGLQSRTPQPEATTGAFQFLKILVLIVIVILETYLNSNFLAKGSVLGLLGGIIEAFTFAVMNIGFSFLLTMFGIKQIVHANFFRKLIGFLSILAWIAVIVTINLALAHYREISGSFIEDAGLQVIERIRSNPLGVTEMKSWVLFGLGLLFAFIAMADVFALVDRYPGYHKVWKKWLKLHEEYHSSYNLVFRDLVEVKDDYSADIETIGLDLSKRFKSLRYVLKYRKQLPVKYKSYLEGLQGAADLLFSIYYTANRETRTDPPPDRFNQRYLLKGLPLEDGNQGAVDLKELKKKVETAKEMLLNLLEEIYGEFESSRKEYRNLDNLIDGLHEALDRARESGNDDIVIAYINGAAIQRLNKGGGQGQGASPETSSS